MLTQQLKNVRQARSTAQWQHSAICLQVQPALLCVRVSEPGRLLPANALQEPGPVCCHMLVEAIRSARLAHAAHFTLWILSVWMEKKGSGNLHSGDGKLCQLGSLMHRQVKQSPSTGSSCSGALRAGQAVAACCASLSLECSTSYINTSLTSLAVWHKRSCRE